MRTALKCLTLVCVLLLPATALAQASLTGTVRDGSGGVLPGVTVEASSPALIEKTRSAVSDGSGQYRIVDLRPGTYSLTFTLPGFVTVKRDGIELTGSQTISIPAEMRVGGIEETITVTGESPVVDVQSSRREIVLDDSTIQSLPATRAGGAVLNATPGIFVGDAALSVSPAMTSFNARSSTINAGSVAGEGRYAINGFPLTAARSGGFSSYVYDTVNADEIAVTVGGGLGESDIGGPIMNIIPRSGGNNFTGTAFYNNAGEWSSGNNLTSEIQALNPNLRENPGVLKTYDWSVSYGGPIMKDRLWFFGNYRDLSGQTAMEGIQANANAGNAARWDWIGSPINARLVQDRTMLIGRVTGQFGKHRVRINSEYQARCEGTPLKVETKGCHNRGEDWIGLGNNQAPIQMSPEATQTAGRGYFDVPFYVNQGTWTMPANSKLLLEAGVTIFRYQPIFGHPAPDGDTTLTSVTEQSNAINPVTNLQYAPVANYRYRGVESWGPANGKTDDVLGSASYVTGANSLKFGYQYRKLDLLDKDVANRSQLGYRFNQGVPNAVSYYLPDFGRRTVTKTNSFYVQDSLTRGRLTLQGALRYDHASSYAPSELNGTTNTSFLNPQAITIPLTPGVDAYNDLTPRVGVAYDVFGNGRTALKFNYGKYLAYAANDAPYTSTNPGATVVRNVMNRGWTDGNRNYRVDCDLLNPALQDALASGGDLCAAATGTAPNFGKLGAATVVDPAVLSGWGVRPGDTQYTVTLQQEIRPRLSGEVSFTHRSFTGFFVTDDLNRRAGGVASYYESYTLTAPSDSRLADGGAYPVTVFVPLTNAAPSTILMREKDLGEERSSVWDGFELALNSRLRNGLIAQVGTTTGRGKVNDCQVTPLYNNVVNGVLTGPNTRGCDNVEPWQTTLRGLVTYTIPKIDVLISTVLRSQPSSAITANWQVPNSMIVGALGHLPVGATATGTTTILLTDNEHRVYADERRTQVDMRFAKVLRFSRTRTDVGVDVNNLFNTSYATGFNQTYVQGTNPASSDNLGPRPAGWGTPTGLAFPRFVRFNLTFNF
jgi:Carboxypeptidase regulatory-like domain